MSYMGNTHTYIIFILFRLYVFIIFLSWMVGAEKAEIIHSLHLFIEHLLCLRFFSRSGEYSRKKTDKSPDFLELTF